MENLTPHWKEIKEDDAEVHSVLQSAAELLYNQASNGANEFADVDLQAGIDAGYLLRDGEAVNFQDDKVFLDYVIRHGAKLALQAWDDLEVFSETLANISHHAALLKSRSEIMKRIIAVLAHDYNKDIIGRFKEAADWANEDDSGRHTFWNLYTPFYNALPELIVEPEYLADALDSVLRASVNDGTSGLMYGAVTQLASRSLETADRLYQVFSSRPQDRVVSLTVNALLGLSKFDFSEAHSRALTLTESGKITLRRVGIDTLGRLEYDKEHSELLELTWERLEYLRSRPDPETDYILVGAYGNLLFQKEEAKSALLDFASRSAPSIQRQVASVLFRNVDKECKKSWFKSALLRLAQGPLPLNSHLDTVDHCVSQVAEHNPDFALQFWEDFISSHDYGRDDVETDLSKVFSTTFHHLCDSAPETLESAITRWFASSDFRLHEAARDIVQAWYLNNKTSGLNLDKAALEELSEQEIIYTLERIMGHIFDGRGSAQLFVSALQRDSCSPAFLNFVAEALSEYVVYNYPGGAGDYLRDIVASDDSSQIAKEVAEAVLSHSDAYFEAHRSLPDLKEAHPSSQHVYLLRLAQRKQRAEMMETANAESALLSLVTKVPLKYGGSYFYEQGGKLSEPAGLKSISTVSEMPRGEFVDPVGQAHLRATLRAAGLRETEDRGVSGEEPES